MELEGAVITIAKERVHLRRPSLSLSLHLSVRLSLAAQVHLRLPPGRPMLKSVTVPKAEVI